MQIEEYIRAVPDFPKAGILFRDITPLLANSEAFEETVSRLVERVNLCGADVIAGIESRGFIFGVPVAQRLGLPFVPIRKPGKLPCETVVAEYALEYGSDQLELHVDAIKPDQRVFIVDDLLATGGTANAACTLVTTLGGVVSGVGVVIELEGLDGREKLAPNRCESLLRF